MPSPPPPSMPLTPAPARAAVLTTNLAAIQSRITTALSHTPTPTRPVRLVAVSKLKPATDILALYNAPAAHRHFGENYTQELTHKASLLPADICWHFIGGLQTNKCRALAERVANLWCVSSVDSAKKADALDKGRGALRQEQGVGRLRVQVQVNTSGEAAKSGVPPDEAVALCRHIRGCEHLELAGLMTIGAIARSKAGGEENADFQCLVQVRELVVRELGLADGDLELGMGMSSDFEGAVRMGSDEVRVGSDIFGERPPKSEARVVED